MNVLMARLHHKILSLDLSEMPQIESPCSDPASIALPLLVL